MAVIAVWKCDRDGAMFENKKDAEAHDKMLELAESITGLLNRNIDNLDARTSRDIGLLLAERRVDLAKALKGNPDALHVDPADVSKDASEEEQNVATLAANR